MTHQETTTPRIPRNAIMRYNGNAVVVRDSYWLWAWVTLPDGRVVKVLRKELSTW